MIIKSRKYIILALLIIQLVLLMPRQGEADDFGSALKAAITAFPAYPDIAGIGGAWAAVPRLSSDNPASLSVFNEYELKFVFYVNPIQVRFNGSQVANVVNSGVLIPLADGCLKIAYASIDTDRMYNKKMPGSDHELDSQDVKVYYGRHINDQIALGLLFKAWGSSKVRLRYPGITLGKSRGSARFNVSPGVLYQPVKNCYLGLTYEYGKERVKTTNFDPYIFTQVKAAGNSYIRICRMGTAWQPRDGTLLALDWRVGKIDDPGTGDYDINMFFFGIEQYIHQNVALRLGSLDGSVTAGTRFSYRNLFIDYAYINESLRDLDPHWGSSEAHTVAVSLVF